MTEPLSHFDTHSSHKEYLAHRLEPGRAFGLFCITYIYTLTWMCVLHTSLDVHVFVCPYRTLRRLQTHTYWLISTFDSYTFATHIRNMCTRLSVTRHETTSLIFTLIYTATVSRSRSIRAYGLHYLTVPRGRNTRAFPDTLSSLDRLAHITRVTRSNVSISNFLICMCIIYIVSALFGNDYHDLS